MAIDYALHGAAHAQLAKALAEIEAKCPQGLINLLIVVKTSPAEPDENKGFQTHKVSSEILQSHDGGWVEEDFEFESK